MSEYHTAVLLGESVSALVDNPSGTYIDATFGGGGHTAEILSRLNGSGRVIAFDRDSDAIGNRIDDERLTLIHNNFRFVHNFIMLDAFNRGENPEEAKADGILADLGVSSHQFDTAERGFSFRYDAPLDMRMDKSSDRTAEDIVNSYDEQELEKIFRLYGEVQCSGRIAGLIAGARKEKAISTTAELDKVLEPVLPKFAAHKLLAKIYQALRIEVNGEMRSLEKFLSESSESLKDGGRLVVITYHSLEDRMVKNFIRCGNVEGREETDMYGRRLSPFTALNRKPVLPSEEEIASNTRARSAKMRAAIKNPAMDGSERGNGRKEGKRRDG